MLNLNLLKFSSFYGLSHTQLYCSHIKLNISQRKIPLFNRCCTINNLVLQVVADESLCLRRQAKPAAVEPCLLPCPYDCVLSPWSEWSTCSHGCSSPHLVALRQRNRTVVAPPGPGKLKPLFKSPYSVKIIYYTIYLATILYFI